MQIQGNKKVKFLCNNIRAEKYEPEMRYSIHPVKFQKRPAPQN